MIGFRTVGFVTASTIGGLCFGCCRTACGIQPDFMAASDTEAVLEERYGIPFDVTTIEWTGNLESGPAKRWSWTAHPANDPTDTFQGTTTVDFDTPRVKEPWGCDKTQALVPDALTVDDLPALGAATLEWDCDAFTTVPTLAALKSGAVDVGIDAVALVFDDSEDLAETKQTVAALTRRFTGAGLGPTDIGLYVYPTSVRDALPEGDIETQMKALLPVERARFVGTIERGADWPSTGLAYDRAAGDFPPFERIYGAELQERYEGPGVAVLRTLPPNLHPRLWWPEVGRDTREVRLQVFAQLPEGTSTEGIDKALDEATPMAIYIPMMFSDTLVSAGVPTDHVALADPSGDLRPEVLLPPAIEDRSNHVVRTVTPNATVSSRDDTWTIERIEILPNWVFPIEGEARTLVRTGRLAWVHIRPDLADPTAKYRSVPQLFVGKRPLNRFDDEDEPWMPTPAEGLQVWLVELPVDPTPITAGTGLKGPGDVDLGTL